VCVCVYLQHTLLEQAAPVEQDVQDSMVALILTVVYVCMYVCVCVCICMYVCVCVYVYVSECVCVGRLEKQQKVR